MFGVAFGVCGFLIVSTCSELNGGKFVLWPLIELNVIELVAATTTLEFAAALAKSCIESRMM